MNYHFIPLLLDCESFDGRNKQKFIFVQTCRINNVQRNATFSIIATNQVRIRPCAIQRELKKLQQIIWQTALLTKKGLIFFITLYDDTYVCFVVAVISLFSRCWKHHLTFKVHMNYCNLTLDDESSNREKVKKKNNLFLYKNQIM